MMERDYSDLARSTKFINYCRLMALIVHVVPDITRKYFETRIFKDKTFKEYLEEKRHILLHLYHERPCCSKDCTTEISKRKVLSKEQFHLIFSPKDTSKEINGHVIYSKGIVIQSCFCAYKVKENVGFHILDITLSIVILKYCEEELFRDSVKNWMTVLQRSRNELAHLTDFREIDEHKYQELFKWIKESLEGLSSCIGNDCKKNLYTKIENIQTLSFEYEIDLFEDRIHYEYVMFKRAMLQIRQRASLPRYHKLLEAVINNTNESSAVEDNVERIDQLCSTVNEVFINVKGNRTLREMIADNVSDGTVAMEWVPVFMKIDLPNTWNKNRVASVLQNYPDRCDLMKILHISIKHFELITEVAKQLIKEVTKMKKVIETLMVKMLTAADKKLQSEISVNLIVPGKQLFSECQQPDHKISNADGHQQVEKAEMVKDKTSELAKKVETTDSDLQANTTWEKSSYIHQLSIEQKKPGNITTSTNPTEIKEHEKENKRKIVSTEYKTPTNKIKPQAEALPDFYTSIIYEDRSSPVQSDHGKEATICQEKLEQVDGAPETNDSVEIEQDFDASVKYNGDRSSSQSADAVAATPRRFLGTGCDQIGHFKFYLKRQVKLSELSDCTAAVLHGNNIIFANSYTKAIVIYNSQGIMLEEIAVPYGDPFGIDIYVNKLYVSMPDLTYINVINLISKEFEEQISVDRYCFSLVCSEKICVLVHSANGLIFINLVTRDRIRICQDKTTERDRLCSTDGVIYYSNFTTRIITAYRQNGRKLRSIQLQCSPLALTSFDNENIYVICNDTHVYNIFVDKQTHVLKCQKTGFESLKYTTPAFIMYQKILSKLFILDKSNKLLIYEYISDQ